MKKPSFVTPLILSLLALPAFAGNDKNFTYLALGDSVPFGMNPLLLLSPDVRSESFVGFPEVIAEWDHLAQSKKEVNAACPGETSSSFLGLTTRDLGCYSEHLNPAFPAFKTSGLMHVAYGESQMQFAQTQLQNNKHINLVTLMTGANDVLLAIQDAGCPPPPVGAACAQAAVLGALPQYGANLTAILTNIRANYNGTLVLVKYYSPSPELDGVAMALNATMDSVALYGNLGGSFKVKFADGFSAFQAAAVLAGFMDGDACKAGLVIPLPPGTPGPPCDIHPTKIGREILAKIIELAK